MNIKTTRDELTEMPEGHEVHGLPMRTYRAKRMKKEEHQND